MAIRKKINFMPCMPFSFSRNCNYTCLLVKRYILYLSDSFLGGGFLYLSCKKLINSLKCSDVGCKLHAVV